MSVPAASMFTGAAAPATADKKQKDLGQADFLRLMT